MWLPNVQRGPKIWNHTETVRFIYFQPEENETFQILKNLKHKKVKLMMIFNVTIQKVLVGKIIY